MDNKNDHQLSDDYIDKILEETESTGDVLDDLTTVRNPIPHRLSSKIFLSRTNSRNDSKT